MNASNNTKSISANTAAQSAVRALTTEIAGIAALKAALVNGLGAPFERAVAAMQQASGRVIVTGMGKSGHIGRKIAATMASTGTPAYFVHPGEASHGDLGMIQSGDVILALSWSGETAELADIITYSRRFRTILVAITSNAQSALGAQADICLALPRAEEACPIGLAPTTSTTMQLVMGDALAIALLEARGFTAQDFGVFHPGGKLGAKLRYVRDLMHVDAAIPHVRVGASMADAIMEMSKKGFGCVGVLDTRDGLAGIITDGDLRRHMRADLMAAAVEEAMTANPRTIRPDMLAAEALEIMNGAKITALFVIESDRKICGVIHLHDLLRAGVA